MDGAVVDGAHGQYRVETAGGALLCTLRGRLRKQLIHPISHNVAQKARRANIKARDPIAVGDRVRVLPTGGGAGVIEEIAERAGAAFVREDSANGGKGRITSVAGIDQMVAVFSARDPAPHLGMLDRVLALAESQGVAAVVCLNKTDLGLDPALAARLDLYRRLGYPVVLTSVASGEGLEALRGRLAGHTSALLGPSGVGKSSLLNALEPGLAQRVSAVSQSTHKGRHTTTGTRLIPLGGPAGGAIADTAGIRTLGLGVAGSRGLDACFPEFRPYLGALLPRGLHASRRAGLRGAARAGGRRRRRGPLRQLPAPLCRGRRRRRPGLEGPGEQPLAGGRRRATVVKPAA